MTPAGQTLLLRWITADVEALVAGSGEFVETAFVELVETDWVAVEVLSSVCFYHSHDCNAFDVP